MTSRAVLMLALVTLPANLLSQDLGAELRKVARQGRPEQASALLAKGAMVDAPDRDGDTALLIATRRSYLGMIMVLRDAGADPTLANRKGETALELARARWRSGGYPIVALELTAAARDAAPVSQPAFSQLLRQIGGEELTAYRERVAPRYVEALLKKGASPEWTVGAPGLRANLERPVLAHALFVQHYALADVILAAGADVNRRFESATLESSKPTMVTALEMAVDNGRAYAVTWLLAHGAEPNTLTQAGTPVLFAAITRNRDQNNDAIFAAFLQKGYKVGLRDQDGRTALHEVAAAAQRIERRLAFLVSDSPKTDELVGMTKRLLDAGADVNATDAKGFTPLRESIGELRVTIARNGEQPTTTVAP